jgi:hypothetical protein
MADRIVTRLSSPAWWLETPERRTWYFGHEAIFGRRPPEQRLRDPRRRRKLVAA